MFEGIQPMSEPHAECLGEPQDNKAPSERCRTSHHEKSWERQAQETRCKIRGQSRARKHPAKDQDRCSPLCKPEFAFRDLRGKTTKRRALKPSASSIAGKGIKARIAHPNA